MRKKFSSLLLTSKNHHLLALMSFQTFMAFFFHRTKTGQNVNAITMNVLKVSSKSKS